MFRLDLRLDRDPCETSWELERYVTDETTYRVHVDGSSDGDDYRSREYSRHHYIVGGEASTILSRSLCLASGRYRFVVRAAFGDGIAAPGYYVVALDGAAIAGSSGFGAEEETRFAVVPKPPSPPADAHEGSAGGSSAEGSSAEGSSADEAATGDADVDDSFSTFVPERLSGIIDLSLMSTVDDKRAETTEEDGPPSNSSQTWTEILNDDFEHGLGTFRASAGADAPGRVTYYPFVKGRRGVIRLQNERADGYAAGSSVRSDVLAAPGGTIRVVFSYYANSMEARDGFCVDHGGADDGSPWVAGRCWHAAEDFENGRWYDGVEATFRRGEGRGFRIRFRCKADSLHDDVLVDRVQLLGLLDGTEVKDSI